MNSRTRKTISAWAWLYAALLVLPALCASTRPAQATLVSLVQNGDFTQTTVTGTTGGFLCNNAGGSVCTSQVTGWTATCAKGGCTGTATPSSVMFAGTNGSAWNGGFGLYWSGIGDPPLGGNAIGIDGDARYTSVLSQSVAGLNVGQTYILQFYQAASQQIGLSGATTEQWQVSLGGSTAQISPLQNTASKSASPWQQVTLSFVASAASEVLQFVALGTPAGEPPVCLLGDVSLNASTAAVPEPATLALVGGGLLGLLTLGRRKGASKKGLLF